MRLSSPEVIVILVVALLMFGGSRIPELGRGLGLGLRGFRDALRGGEDPAAEADKKADKAKDNDGNNKTS